MINADQFDLFGGMVDRGEDYEKRDPLYGFVREHVRSADPDTSRDAAESVVSKVTIVQQRILAIHADYDGLTDEELTRAYIERYGPTGESSIRSRRNDLARKGKFVDSEERRALSTGRMGIVWKLVISS